MRKWKEDEEIGRGMKNNKETSKEEEQNWLC